MWGQHVLPPRVHDVIDPELERNLRFVRHVLGVSKNLGTYDGIVNGHGFARDVELITPRLRLGKGLESEPAIPQQVVSLRGSRDNEHKETVVR